MTYKKYLIIASILFLAFSCNRKAPVSPATAPSPQPASSTPIQLPIRYDNKEYGFIFSLPQNWLGFTTFAKQWQGFYLPDNQKTTTGPEIIIRNPKWTAAKPYEDIPIMVFTLAEWDQVQTESLNVSAAPFPPSELGRNAKYVFALPPRFDYDFATGYEEVEQIVQSQPLKAY